MKQSKFLILALIACSLLVLTSCVGVGQAASGWSGPAVQDGIIYVASKDGGLVAVNSSSGDVLWFYGMVTTSGGGLFHPNGYIRDTGCGWGFSLRCHI